MYPPKPSATDRRKTPKMRDPRLRHSPNPTRGLASGTGSDLSVADSVASVRAPSNPGGASRVPRPAGPATRRHEGTGRSRARQ
jgi:hypothetical protein